MILLTSATIDGIPLTLLPGSRVLTDDTYAPRWRATLLIAPPPAPVLALLDPQAGARITITAGTRTPSGDVLPLTLNLGLRSRPERVTPTDHTLTLELASDEALAIDGSPTALATVSAASTSAAVLGLLTSALGWTPALDIRVDGPAVTVDHVSDRWSATRDIVERSGLALYDAGARTWVLDARPTSCDAPVAELSTGPGGTITAYNRDVSRAGGWANYVLYRYTWSDATNTEHVVVATAYIASGPYAATGPAGRKVWQEDRPGVAVSQAAANSAAADVVTRLVTRGRLLQVTIIGGHDLRPGNTVAVTLPDTARASWLITAIEWDLAAGLATLTLRQPADVTVGSSTPTGPGGDTGGRTSSWPTSRTRSYASGTSVSTDLIQTPTGTHGWATWPGPQVERYTADPGSADPGYLVDVLAAVTIDQVILKLQSSSPPTGTPRIWIGVGSIPDGYPDIGFDPATPVPALDVSWPAEATTLDVDITSIVPATLLKSGNFAISVGPAPAGGDSHTMYGYGQGTLSPRLRVTYH